MVSSQSSCESEMLAKLDIICNETIAVNATEVDKDGCFPRENITALGQAGILGLISAVELGGMGLGLDSAIKVSKCIARACPSTGMIVTMHFCGSAILEEHGAIEVRRDIAQGSHLTTLAFSEFGSRSHFWSPVSSATRIGDHVLLNARKSWVTSAKNADSYVWSSKPMAGTGASSLWYVPRNSPGLRSTVAFDGMGLRGNDSAPVIGADVRLPLTHLLSEDGNGLTLMLDLVLPYFLLIAGGVSVGLMQGALARTISHVSGIAYESGDCHLVDLPTIRAYVARMQIDADLGDALLNEAVAAVLGVRDDALRRILGSKAGVAELACKVVATGMRVCGGSAFRKEVGLDRFFRDAQAATVMSPTTDILYDLLGRHTFGLPLL